MSILIVNKKVMLGLAAGIILSASVASAGQAVSCVEMPGCLDKSHADYIYCMETYKVGDKEESLNSIVDMYIKKNTYSKREHNEFKSGVIEANPWLEEYVEENGDIKLGAGEEIHVYFWKKAK